MGNNENHNANYSLKTVTGKMHNMGFRQTSGNTNSLASRGSKLVRTPLTIPLNKRWNSLVNGFISDGNEHGIELLEKIEANEDQMTVRVIEVAVQEIEKAA